MENERISFLVECYKDNSITKAELDELNKWFQSVQIGSKSMHKWIAESGGEERLADQSFERFKAKIHFSTKRYSWKYTIGIAASTLIFISSVLLINNHNENTLKNITHKSANVRNTRNKATITLANGKQIILDEYAGDKVSNNERADEFNVNDGKVTYITGNDNVAGLKPAFNTLTTPKGGTYKLALADGTEVTLDAASSITYPVSFNGLERVVSVVGQAYFKVIHNSSQPFIVKAKGQILRDIGTEFNVSAYNDDLAMKTTLTQGSISISNSANSKILIPGEQAIVKENDLTITIARPSLEDVLAWTKGNFSFHHQSISEILKQASRWYDIEVVYNGKKSTKTFGGKLNREGSVHELLESLRIISGIQYRIEGRRVTIMN
jgi:transmembrane sensor